MLRHITLILATCLYVMLFVACSSSNSGSGGTTNSTLTPTPTPKPTATIVTSCISGYWIGTSESTAYGSKHNLKARFCKGIYPAVTGFIWHYTDDGDWEERVQGRVDPNYSIPSVVYLNTNNSSSTTKTSYTGNLITCELFKGTYKTNDGDNINPFVVWGLAAYMAASGRPFLYLEICNQPDFGNVIYSAGLY